MKLNREETRPTEGSKEQYLHADNGIDEEEHGNQ